MSYGPQLPPHLQKQHSESSEDEEPCGPKLPSEPCRGPKPPEQNFGPQLPPHLQKSQESDSDSESYGPKLPSIPCRAPAPGPSIGPQVPVEESSDEDDLIGPLPPKPGEELQTANSIARSIELRAQQMKDRLEGREAKSEPKRESWMLELPAEKAKNFGLGPRQFSRSSNPKPKQDKSWTQAPNQEASNDNEDHSQDEDVLAYMASLQRDAEMDKVAEAYKKKRGNESLLDLHSKKMKAKKEDKPAERRPFDRNVDLQVNKFDDAQKKAMLKKAAKLDSRFTSGSSKYV